MCSTVRAGLAADDGGVSESLRRDRARLDPTGLDVEGIARDGDIAVVDEVVDGRRKPSARSMSGARKVTPASDASAIGTGSSGGLPKPMMSNSIVGAVVGGVVHQLLHQQRVDPLKQAGHRQREHLGGPARFDAGAVERRLPGGAGGLEFVDDLLPHAQWIDEPGDRCRHHVLARRQQHADVVDGALRVHLALGHVEHAVRVEGDDLVGILRRGHADVADPADRTDVAAGLGIAVDEGTREFQVRMIVDGGDGVAADRASGPLNDAQHW